MIYDKLFEEFIEEIKKEGTYATTDEIRDITMKMLTIIKDYQDATPEELVEKVIEDNIKQLEEIKNSYPVPGYTVGVNVGNINVKMFGGSIDNMKRKMPEDALFDIASMTKFYTEIIAYHLIKEGFFSFQDKIRDLDSRFENVGDLTVGEVLSFQVEFKTNGYLKEKTTIEEAIECLYTMEVVSTKNYNYNDLGMMLMKEVMEAQTGKSYKDLVEEYITQKYNLSNTYLVVPKNKIEKVTGSPNAHLGKVNDSSALAVGGYSGHAGIITSNDDLIHLGQIIREGSLMTEEMLRDAYTPGIKENRGIMGNTYTSHEKGIEMSFVDRLEPITNFAIQGSTRTQMNIGKNSTSTILLNPSSMGLERAIEEEAKINQIRFLKNQPPLSLVKNFRYNQNGEMKEYNLIDARQMVPCAKTVEPITTQNAILALRLRFLNKIILEYDRNYTSEIKVSKRIK